VLIAIVAASIYLLARVSRPSDALLGCIPGRDGFYKLHREPRAKAVPGLAVYLVQSSLVFFNIDYVRDRIRWIVDRLPQSTRWFIIDAEAVTTIERKTNMTSAPVPKILKMRRISSNHSKKSIWVSIGYFTVEGSRQTKEWSGWYSISRKLRHPLLISDLCEVTLALCDSIGKNRSPAAGFGEICYRLEGVAESV
jgi:MFS superfamily sulfate permease-like transporter